MVTGSNVGSNAALMPVQKALGLAAGLPPLLAPGVHNFAGAAGAGMSFGVTAMVCGELLAAASVMVIVPLYVPAVRPEMLTDTVMVSVSPVEVPLIGLQLSHEALSVML